MDTLEAIQLPITSRTFWNSNDPTLDPFDETLVSTMASPLEACSSTFLFPSTSTTCCDVDSDDNTQVFKRPSHHSTIFDAIALSEGGAESKGVVTNPPGSSTTMEYHSTSQFSWLSAPVPHGYPPAQGVSASLQGQVRDQFNHYGGGQLVPDFFGPLNSSTASTALDNSGHGSENHTSFVKAPLMRQPSFRRPDSGQAQLNVVKASWQSANMFEQRRVHVSHKEPLGSPCSVISGFTKVVDQFVASDYNMEISGSFGPSTSALAAHDEPAGKYVSHNLQESTPASRVASAPEGACAQSMSGTQEMADMGVVKQILTTKRKRSKLPKHCNEVESQRMTHIAVERNRRKQMNEHLAALRALMPGSYVQKGDQASIVGGAIEFVKELEHLLHCLQAQKRRRAYSELSNAGTPTSRLAMPNPEPQFCQIQPPFSFHSPQRLVDQSPFLLGASTENSLSAANARHGVITSYPTSQQLPVGLAAAAATMILSPAASSSSSTLQQGVSKGMSVDMSGGTAGAGLVVGEVRSDMASVEVKLVGSDAALVKIMALRRSGQLLRTVVALESLALTVMHTNITTVGHTVLYSFHVQIGALCRMNVDEIARALHQTFGSLHALQF